MLRSTGSALDFDPTFAVLALNSDHRFSKAPGYFRVVLPVLATALALSCGSSSDPVAEEFPLDFADVVDFQAQNVTTDLISVPEGLGMATVDHGWKRADDAESGAAWLAVAGKLGRLSIFSADGDLEELELDLSLESTGEKRQRSVQVFLNGNRLDRLHLQPEWASYTVLVPSEFVRRGLNILELAPRAAERHGSNARKPQIRMRRIRFRSRSGRSVWPEGPQEIQVSDSIEMPVSSYLDLVLRVPRHGRLIGTFQFDMALPRSGPAYAYIQLLDQSGGERTLLNRRFLKTDHRGRELDLSLAGWEGELVRLRLGATGPGNGVVRWFDLHLAASSVIETPTPLPPIVRSNPERSARLGQPDVLVILLDAARADAFSPFGGPHPTPAAERLAGDGTVFEQALSAAPWTAQSVPAMLTGLHPDTLRVGPLGSVLSDGVPTLPEILSAKGYRTVLWSQHPLYQNHKGFQRGFEEIHKAPPGSFETLPTAQELVDDQRPTFAWVHLIPPHAPYRPPEPFAGSQTANYSGSMDVEAQFLGRFPHSEDQQSLSEDDLQYARNRYQENVAFADSLVAQILVKLEERGRYGNSLIILLSDHGEAFLEHGIFLHTRNLHTELLHVPLIVKWPANVDGFAARVPSPVSLIDVMPTLVDGLGLESAAGGFQGSSLLPAALDGVTDVRTLYAVTRGVEAKSKPPKPGLMLQSGPWRILHDPLRDLSKLYNHHTDPGETTDLSVDRPLQTLLLRQGLLSQRNWNRQLLEGPPGEAEVEELDPEAIEQLKALGYLN